MTAEPIRLYGGPARVAKCRHSEVASVGPVGTGKTAGMLFKLHALCSSWRGLRVLLYRKVKATMPESVLADFENLVLGGDASRHPALVPQRVDRRNRQRYRYRTGSEIVVAGVDQWSKLMSTNYTIACCPEATELSEEDFEGIHTRLRYRPPGFPFTQHILDCNPADPYHWIRRRILRPHAIPELAARGRTQMTEIRSRLEDNPAFYDHDRGCWTELGEEYRATLAGITGVRRLRLVDGIWAAAEGVIYDCFDEDVHIISWAGDHRPGDRAVHQRPVFKRHFGVIDWGFYPDPGVFQLWGVASDLESYRLLEIYRTGWTISDWAQAIAHVWHQTRFEKIVADPSRPDQIEEMNRQLTRYGGRQTHAVVVGANNRVKDGIEKTRFLLQGGGGQRPRMFFCRDAFPFGSDPVLETEHRPTCTEQEIPAYVRKKHAQSGQMLEEPAEHQHDHGCDCIRYAASEILPGKISGSEYGDPGHNPNVPNGPARSERDRYYDRELAREIRRLRGLQIR